MIREYLLLYTKSETIKAWPGQLIVPPANLNRPRPMIACRECLGGLLRFYDREAA